MRLEFHDNRTTVVGGAIIDHYNLITAVTLACNGIKCTSKKFFSVVSWNNNRYSYHFYPILAKAELVEDFYSKIQ